MRSAVIVAVIGSALAAQPTTIPVEGSSSCVEDCSNAYNKCRTEPNANMSSCAAKFSSCLGYNPFDEDGSLVTPTACSSKSAAPTTTATTATTTTVPTGEHCPVKICNNKYDECRSEPGANLSTCGAEYSTCLGYNPFDSDGSLNPPKECDSSSSPSPSPSHSASASASSKGNGTAPVQPIPPVTISGAGFVKPAGIFAVLVVGAVVLL